MNLNLKDVKKFEKQWGKRCKDFTFQCACCQAWLAFDILRDLYAPFDIYKIKSKIK